MEEQVQSPVREGTDVVVTEFVEWVAVVEVSVLAFSVLLACCFYSYHLTLSDCALILSVGSVLFAVVAAEVVIAARCSFAVVHSTGATTALVVFVVAAIEKQWKNLKQKKQKTQNCFKF